MTKESAGMDSAPSLKASNTAVQHLLVQQPVQQRRRTSAKNNNTLRTEKSHFEHTMDMGEHQRTGCVESPLRQCRVFATSPTLSQVRLQGA
jgi:hypothetical protein